MKTIHPVTTNNQPPPPTLCRLSVALVYGILLAFITSATSIAIPQEVAWFQPRFAALTNGFLIFMGCLFNGAAPIIGRISDQYGRRPLMLTGAGILTFGLVGLCVAVSSGRNTFSFVLFCISYLTQSTGLTVLSVSFAGLLADFGKILPDKVGALGGVFSFFNILGAALGFVIQGTVLPVQFNDHRFYFWLVGLVVVFNIGLLRVPPELLKITLSKETIVQEKNYSVFTEWMSEEYAAWRFVLLSRFFFFCGMGVFGALMLYYLEDCTSAGSAAPTMYSYIALVSLASSLLAIWPSSVITDTFGTATAAGVGGTFMAMFMAIVVQLSSIKIILCIVPVYGIGQMFYNVGDMGLVIQSIPNDESKAQDMGAWSASSSFGSALGSVFASVTISWFHVTKNSSQPFELAPSSSSSSNGGVPQRIAYQSIGYEVVFTMAMVFMIGSVLWVWLAARRLANNKNKECVQDQCPKEIITLVV